MVGEIVQPLESFTNFFNDVGKNIGDAWQSTLQWGADTQQWAAQGVQWFGAQATNALFNPMTLMIIAAIVIVLVLIK